MTAASTMPNTVHRRLALLFLATFALGLTGCSGNKPATATGPDINDGEDPGEGIFSGFESSLDSAADWITNSFGSAFGGSTPAHYAQMMESDVPDVRRQGINGLSDRDFGRKPPYTTRYEQIARSSEAGPLVRATALRALNRSRDASAIPLFIRGLSDPAPQVRLESAKALGNMPDPEAVAPLMARVQNATEDKDIRIAAADALRHYSRLDVARMLVGLLNEGEFSIAWQSRRSLHTITGQDHRYDQAAWLAYLTNPDKPLS